MVDNMYIVEFCTLLPDKPDIALVYTDTSTSLNPGYKDLLN